MNRNTESYFAFNPKVEVKRSTFDRSSTLKTSFRAGKLIPIYLDEIYPGDTFQMDISSLIRMSTPIVPVMDNSYLDIYFFFVPTRLVWNHWEEFNGANKTGYWSQNTVYTIPKLNWQSGGSDIGQFDLINYLGLPSVSLDPAVAPGVNHLPIRAYWKIWNDWFRSEVVEPEALITLGDTATIFNNDSNKQTLQYAMNGSYVAPVSKFHDYFTSCLPEPQKGPDVKIPVINNPSGSPLAFKMDTGAPSSFSLDSNGNLLSNDTDFYEGSNLIDIDNSFIGTINQLRTAFQLQKLYEKDARGGTRYIEIIREHFGVTSPDYRLQRSEYLGGKRIPITMQEITQTSETNTTPIGTVSAKSVTRDIASLFTKSFTEHGYLIGLVCARYDHTYSQGIEKLWTRNNRTDFYLPVLANIGEQPVYKYEIYAPELKKDPDVFGYQEAWADLKYKPNRLSGYMQTQLIGNPLGIYWTYGDKYTSSPSLSAAWLHEDASIIDRTLAVQNSEQYFADFYFKCKCTRPMPLYSIPGLADHH